MNRSHKALPQDAGSIPTWPESRSTQPKEFGFHTTSEEGDDHSKKAPQRGAVYSVSRHRAHAAPASASNEGQYPAHAHCASTASWSELHAWLRSGGCIGAVG